MRDIQASVLSLTLLIVGCEDTPQEPASDTLPPTVSIASPSHGAFLTGSVTVRVDAHDSVRVAEVEILIDGVVAVSDTTVPYEFIWNTDSVVDGPAMLLARAYDAAGNVGSSAPLFVTISHPIRYQGTLSVPQTWNADLDQGTLAFGRPPADIWFQAVTDTERYLTPVGGAEAAIFGGTAPEKPGCLGLTLSTEWIDMQDLPRGTFVCVLTGAGRVSQVSIIGAPSSSPDTLVIGIKTFAFSLTDTTVNPPVLLSPPEDFYVHQYANAPHCDNEYGFSIDYRWTAVPGARWYEIYAIGPNATIPILRNLQAFDTAFTRAWCGTYVASRNAIGWTWRVTVVLQDSTRLTSATGRYNFTDPFQP